MRIATGTAIYGALGTLLGRTDLTVADAHAEALEYDVFLPHRTVSRIRGSAGAGGDRVTWSMIEKVTEGPALASPYLRDNALREYAAYTSGLLDDLAPGVRAPRLLGSEIDSSGRIVLWIEDVASATARPLDSSTLLACAHDLGELAGRWLGRPPAHPWLFTGWIDRHSQPEAAAKGLATLRRNGRRTCDPLGDRREDASRLLSAQPRVRGILEALPQTLCHHDAVGANLFRQHGTTVLVDWESVGPGPAGADLASLLFSSARRGDCSAESVAAVADSAIDAYRAGVDAHADSASAETVRRGFDASVALRWKLVADVADALDHGTTVTRGSAPDEPAEHALEELLLLTEFLVGCARRLLD